MEEKQEDIDIEIEDIVIKEIKEVIIDPKDKEEWDNFNSTWRKKLKEKNKNENQTI